MNREIKFRVWDSKPEKDGYSGIMIPHDYVINSDYLVDALSVKYPIMQYTGLKDKNDKEIYEGDIITADSYPFFDEGKPNYVATVEWIYSSWQIVKHCVNPEKRGISDGINELLDDGEGAADFEVIGNIYENPELLKS